MELRCVKTVAAPSGWRGFSNTGSLPWRDHHSRKMRFVASVCVKASLCFCKVVCSPRRNACGILRCWPLKQCEKVTAGPFGEERFSDPAGERPSATSAATGCCHHPLNTSAATSAPVRIRKMRTRDYCTVTLISVTGIASIWPSG
jgi:hypothetical protein